HHASCPCWPDVLASLTLASTISFSLTPSPPTSSLFPYTTLFRSYFFGWTSTDETFWKENYRIWMNAVRDFERKGGLVGAGDDAGDRKSTRLNSSHVAISYAVFCLKNKTGGKRIPISCASRPAVAQ